jgi:hypothetical protein
LYLFSLIYVSSNETSKCKKEVKMSDDDIYAFARCTYTNLMNEGKVVTLELIEGLLPERPQGRIIQVGYNFIRMDSYPNIRIAMDCATIVGLIL